MFASVFESILPLCRVAVWVFGFCLWLAQFGFCGLRFVVAFSGWFWVLVLGLFVLTICDWFWVLGGFCLLFCFTLFALGLHLCWTF